MRQIQTQVMGEHEFNVDVSDGAGSTRTRHRVTVPPDLAAAYPGDEERLVRESFEFLLEREPASSILGRFSLDVIGRYFPEYEDEIARRMSPA